VQDAQAQPGNLPSAKHWGIPFGEHHKYTGGSMPTKHARRNLLTARAVRNFKGPRKESSDRQLP
jgi:hypothetical protein